MKQLGFIIICLLITSCNYLDVKKTSSEEILNEELQSFNWKEVDVFPTFSSCDSSSTLELRKICFQQTLTDHVMSYLSNEKLIVSKDVNDTVFIDFMLNDKGLISILDIQVDDATIEALPKLKEHLKRSIDTLPKIYPAIKRGQHVSTQFKLPIIIKAD